MKCKLLLCFMEYDFWIIGFSICITVLEVGWDNCFSSFIWDGGWGLLWDGLWGRHMHVSTYVFPLDLGWRGPIKSKAMESKGL